MIWYIAALTAPFIVWVMAKGLIAPIDHNRYLTDRLEDLREQNRKNLR